MKYHISKKRADKLNRNTELFEDTALGILMNKTKTNENIETELIMKLLK